MWPHLSAESRLAVFLTATTIAQWKPTKVQAERDALLYFHQFTYLDDAPHFAEDKTRYDFEASCASFLVGRLDEFLRGLQS